MNLSVNVLHWAALGIGFVWATRYFRALGDVTQAVFNVKRTELIAAVYNERRTLTLIAVAALIVVVTYFAGAGFGWVVFVGLFTTFALAAFPWLWVHVGLRNQQTSARFYPAQSVSLESDVEVLAIEVAGQGWAFPDVEIRRPHIAGIETARESVMTYCALSRIGIAFQLEEPRTQLSVAGQYGNNLIFKADGKCLQQMYSGLPDCELDLPRLPVVRMTWRGFRVAYPNGQVYLNPMVPWRENPFLRLFDEVVDRIFDIALTTHHQTDKLMFETLTHEDSRLPRKTLVWGVVAGGSAAAFTQSFVDARGVVNTEVGGTPVVLTYDRDVDCLAAFERPQGKIVEHVNFAGVSDVGLLSRIPTFYPGMYWFAWVNFFPQTTLDEALR